MSAAAHRAASTVCPGATVERTPALLPTIATPVLTRSVLAPFAGTCQVPGPVLTTGHTLESGGHYSPLSVTEEPGVRDGVKGHGHPVRMGQSRAPCLPALPLT